VAEDEFILVHDVLAERYYCVAADVVTGDGVAGRGSDSRYADAVDGTEAHGFIETCGEIGEIFHEGEWWSRG